MFFVLQFPLADVRPFLEPPLARLPLPTWPIPREGIEFIHFFGGVCRRTKGPGDVDRWCDDLFFCRAHRALALPDAPRTALAGLGLSHCFRRFFFDGKATARVEVGIALRGVGRNGTPLDADSFRGILRSVLDLPTHVARVQEDGRPHRLATQGGAIAKLYSLATSPAPGQASSQPARPWVPIRSGAPMVFVEHSRDEMPAPPAEAQRIPLAGSPELELAFVPTNGPQPASPVWVLTLPPDGGPELMQQARNVRIALLRLHSEYQCFKQVLRLLLAGEFTRPARTKEADALDRYLADARKWIFSASKYGVEHGPIRDIMVGFDSLVTDAEKSLLLQQLDGLRPQNRRALDQAIAPRDRAPEPGPNDFDAFISYNSKDVDEVSTIVDELHARGLRTWFDRDDIRLGTKVVGTLDQVLGRAPSALVFLGGYGLGPWQNEEWQALYHLNHDGKCKIVPVILPSAGESVQVPPFLMDFSRLDLRGSPPDWIDRLCGELRPPQVGGESNSPRSIA